MASRTHSPGSPDSPETSDDHVDIAAALNPQTEEAETEEAETEDTAEAPAADPDRLHLKYVATSHVGLVRKNNQDSGYASPTMLVVADGMGGAAAGDLASAVAVDAAGRADKAVSGEDMLETLAGAIARANDKIADLVADDHSLEGMGTTVSGAMFDGKQLGICHIGDSRIYRLRDGELERLTHDHSWVQSLVDDGKITEEEAAYHPHRSLLLKVLNGHPTNDPDVTMTELLEGDRLILCSDGLCGLVEDEEIAEIAAEPDADRALSDLVEAALQAGGLDNVTVIVADAVTTEQPAADPLVLGAATEQEIPETKPIKVDLGDSPVTDDDDAPVVPTAPRPDDDDEEDQRYAMRPPPRRRWFRRLVTVVAVVLALGALLGGGWAWGRTQFYVGAAGDDVAIYQGLPQNIAGIGLSQVYEVQQVRMDDLPAYYQEKVRRSITSSSLDGARQTVNELEAAAEACRAERNPPTPQPSPSPDTPSGSASPTPAPSPSSSPPADVPC